MIQQLNQVQPFVARLAYSNTKNDSYAKNIVQETLLKVKTKYDQFKTGTNFKG
jgi:DNA-directed RNA polymerase specialized sigma24 family protein